jgi:hypothetical protein
MIFSGWAWADTGFRLIPIPLVARTAPEIFKKPLLLTSIKSSFLRITLENIVPVYFPILLSKHGRQNRFQSYPLSALHGIIFRRSSSEKLSLITGRSEFLVYTSMIV